MKKLSLQIFTALLMFATWIGYSEYTLAAPTQLSDIQINNAENLESAIVIPYGVQDNEAGFEPHGTEGIIGTGITSFFVQNNIFYLLDNVNKKVLITDKKGQTSAMKVEEESFLEEITVSKNGVIYVLDTRSRVVYEYSKNGVLENKLLIPDSLEVPTGIDVNNKGEVVVNQGQEFSVNLSSGEEGILTRPLDDIEVYEVRVNEMLGKVGFKEAGKKFEFTVPFEESFGRITVNSIKGNQIVYTKTEVAADIPKIMAETHVYVANKKGTVRFSSCSP